MSSSDKDNEAASKEQGDDLNALLDSALEDFNKPTKPSDAKVKNENTASNEPATSLESASGESLEDNWTEDFLKQAASQFEKNIQNMLQNGEDSDLTATLQRMAASVASAVSGEAGPTENGPESEDFQAAIANTLKDLTAVSENLQNVSESDLASMFSQASLGEGSADILPFMQGMMQSLLSKDVLYPSLKEIVDRYPSWLEEKKSTLPSESYERYSKQLELMQKVCGELEKEKEDDAQEVKNKRYETVLKLMQDMQNCGQPPEDLLGAQPSLFQFDNEGNPILPAGADVPQNCCLM